VARSSCRRARRFPTSKCGFFRRRHLMR